MNNAPYLFRISLSAFYLSTRPEFTHRSAVGRRQQVTAYQVIPCTKYTQHAQTQTRTKHAPRGCRWADTRRNDVDDESGDRSDGRGGVRADESPSAAGGPPKLTVSRHTALSTGGKTARVGTRTSPGHRPPPPPRVALARARLATFYAARKPLPRLAPPPQGRRILRTLRALPPPPPSSCPRPFAGGLRAADGWPLVIFSKNVRTLLNNFEDLIHDPWHCRKLYYFCFKCLIKEKIVSTNILCFILLFSHKKKCFFLNFSWI